MASTFTRTSRRSEGLSTRSSTRSNVAISPSNHNIVHNRLQQSNIGRKKRPRDSIDDDEQALMAKKAKITVEIKPRQQLQPKTRSLIIKRSAKPAAAPVLNPPTSPPPPTTEAPPPNPEIATQTPIKAPTPPARKPADHQQKVANGIKHELDRLNPKAADLKDEKRKLRSQEGARFKSELSAYFPEYDEVIGNEPKEEHILNVDTPIIIIDSAKTSTKPSTSSRKLNAQHQYPLKEYPSSIFHNTRNAERVDFSFMFKNYKEEGGEDPLSREYFEAIHKRPERQEKGIRNNDKGRAKHEKDQVIRLLEGLQGHDWLKLMGVNGVTDSKRKEYEPARDHFIKGCEAILAKFQTWKDEEKRRKLERDAAQAEAQAESEQMDVESDHESNGDPPDYSDIDASAARQLHEEATARSAPVVRPPARRSRAGAIVVLADEEPQKEFTSFFAKPHLRASALGKHRRSNRGVAAWGHPIPEIPEVDFELPEEFRDEEALKTHARRKRRDRRISKS